MKDLQVRRFAGALQRIFGLQGMTALSLNETLQPTFELLAPAAPEHAFSIGWRRFACRITQGAVAGNFGRIDLFNPTKSGLLVVLEEVNLFQSSGQKILIATDRVPPGGDVAINSLLARDTRIGPAQCGLRNVTTSAAAPTIVTVTHLVLDNPSLPVPRLDLVLAPGTYARFEGAVVNTAVDLVFRWREFTAAPQEDQPGFGG